MELSLLEEIGLTQREIKVYVALLELGLTTSGAIIKKSGVPNSKIYETLEKLMKKGLVSFVFKGSKRHYRAGDPKIIIDFLDEKKRDVQVELLPRLEGLYNSTIDEKEATIYEGIKGIKAVFERVLKEMKSGDTIYVLGVSKKANDMLGAYLRNFHERRIKKGIALKVLYHPDAKNYAREREKMPLTEVKTMSDKSLFPAWIDIFGNYVVIFNVSESPTAFLIKDSNIANNFRSYFNMIWNSIK
jgi:HTH-type transcriptional regulator, sugar sensing transcriptional regulator